MTIGIALQLLDEFLNLEVAWIERGARLVHQDDARLNGDGAGDAQALLLAAREADAAGVQASFTSSHRAAPRRLFSTTSSSLLRSLMPWICRP